MSAQSTLTKDRVVEQLTAQLTARRTLAVRRNAAYERLAQHVLLIPVTPCTKDAA